MKLVTYKAHKTQNWKFFFFFALHYTWNRFLCCVHDALRNNKLNVFYFRCLLLTLWRAMCHKETSLGVTVGNLYVRPLWTMHVITLTSDRAEWDSCLSFMAWIIYWKIKLWINSFYTFMNFTWFLQLVFSNNFVISWELVRLRRYRDEYSWIFERKNGSKLMGFCGVWTKKCMQLLLDILKSSSLYKSSFGEEKFIRWT